VMTHSHEEKSFRCFIKKILSKERGRRGKKKKKKKTCYEKKAIAHRKTETSSKNGKSDPSQSVHVIFNKVRPRSEGETRLGKGIGFQRVRVASWESTRKRRNIALARERGELRRAANKRGGEGTCDGANRSQQKKGGGSPREYLRFDEASVVQSRRKKRGRKGKKEGILSLRTAATSF